MKTLLKLFSFKLIPSSVLSFEAMVLRKSIFTCYFVNNQKMIYKGLLNENLPDGAGCIENIQDIKNAIFKFMLYYDNIPINSKQINKQVQLLDGYSNSNIERIIVKLTNDILKPYLF